MGLRVTSLSEGVGIAIDALRANKVRSALTILGVAIGVLSVVLMSSAIHGINESVSSQFEAAGPTTFYLFRFPISFEACDGSDDSCKWRNNPRITLRDADNIARLSSIRGVTASTQTGASVKFADRALSAVTVEGNTDGWFDVEGGSIEPGRDFTRSEADNGARVMIVNTVMAQRLFGDADPLGKVVIANGTPFDIVGVYHDLPPFAGEIKPKAIVPFLSARRALGAGDDWVQLSIKPMPNVPRDEAVDDVTALLRASRGLRPSQDNNFAIVTQDKLFETWNKITGAFFLVMFVLSGIGLIVGGVGVVAIMMISVTERTREIGVRKALGATRRLILWQFLVEAVTLTGIGAVIGLFLGWGMSFAVRHLFSLQTAVPVPAVIIALISSALTGVLFGLIPASRAAKLDPVLALRYE